MEARPHRVLIVDVMRPFVAPVFWFNLVFRKLGDWFYGPRIVAMANRYALFRDK